MGVFIQSSTHMCVDRAFKILEGKWMIVKRMFDTHCGIYDWYKCYIYCATQYLYNWQGKIWCRKDRRSIERIERQISNKSKRERQEMNTKIASISEVRNIISTKNNIWRTKEVLKDIKNLWIKWILLLEIIIMHEAIVKLL